MARKKTQVIFDAWDTYVRETDDYPFFISFDVEAAQKDLTDTLLHCAQVAIPIQEPVPSGGPQEPENERLWDMEDQLCTALSGAGVVCRLVGRLTHQGHRVLVFQLDDWDSFRPALRKWIKRCGDYQVRLSESEGWEFFDDCIRPTPEDWLFMADCRVIQGLIEAGSDPQKEHALDFVFLGKPAALGLVAAVLQAEGYEPEQPLDPHDTRIVMVKKMTLDLRTITATSLTLSQLAEAHGVAYDGWGAAVVR